MSHIHRIGNYLYIIVLYFPMSFIEFNECFDPLQCEKLRAESALLPGVQAELDGLRRRHSAALELMGERDEEVCKE